MTVKNGTKRIEYLIVSLLTVLGYLLLMWALTGNGPTHHNPYNSYALQAQSWLEGRLDLGENYSYLELAEYEGKYYVSFPPFPSYVLLPFALMFGSNTPDHLIIWIIDLLTVVYLYRLAMIFLKDPHLACLTSLFVMLGTNATFNLLNPWVWFLAQTLCFLLSVMAVYYAVKGKGGLSLGLWACSVGCRPMQALYLPVLLYLIWRSLKDAYEEAEEAEEGEKNEKYPGLFALIRTHILWAVPPCVIALSYMILNYARFRSVTEFGHNYLPEFMEAEYGQFDVHYFANNLRMLLNIPDFDEEGRMVIDHFGNLNFLIVSPFLIFALGMLVILLLRRKWKSASFGGVILLLSLGYLVVTMMHKTMGGWHFGNRYTNDILPWMFLLTLMGLREYPRAGKYQIPLFVFGLCLNAVGLVVVYNGMYIV